MTPRRNGSAARSSWVLRVFCGLSLFLAAACAGDNRPPGLDVQGPEDGGAQQGSSCEDGAERPCGVTLDQANGVVSCYRGKQYCADNLWGACTDGEFTEEPDRATLSLPGSLKISSLSLPAKCVDNPCDPSCMYFDENPPDITPPAGGSVPLDPGIPDWSTPSGSATCSHQLCTTGAALSASCHPCVASVCSANPACCSTTWNAACVDLVYTQCAGTAQPTALNICDFAGYAQSSIRFGNGGTGSPTIGAGSHGASSTPDGSAVYLETNCRVGAIYAKGGVNLRNGCQINGNVIAEGNAWLEAGSTRLTGSLTSGGNVELRNGTIVTGAIQATGGITLQSGAQAQSTLWAGGVIRLNNPSSVFGSAQSVGSMTGQAGGVIMGNATVNSPSTINPVLQVNGVKNTSGSVTIPPVPNVVLPDLNAYRRTLTSSCTVANSRPNYNVWGPDQTLAPGIYGDVIVYSGYKLILQDGGSYVFKSLRFYAGSQGMRLAGTAKWDVSVCNSFQTDAGIPFYLNGTTTKPNAQDFIVYSAATSGDCISIGDNNVFNGMFIAPDCQIRIYNNYTGTAAFWGKTVYSDSGMNLTNIPAASCQATNVFGGAVCDGTTQLYANGRTYVAGNVVHYNGVKYTCLVGGWCSSNGGYSDAYWPGRGWAWTNAWSNAGACPTLNNPSNNGGSCPVSLTLPATPPARKDCYSGLDCQVNSRCTEVLTSPTCAHSKCVTGAALNATCDECVARICADTPSCCSSSWTAACAAKVETICDATCGPVTSLGCAHDACVVGTALNSSCSPNVAAVCGSPGFAYCCSTTWDQACVNRLFVIETGSPPSTTVPGTSICNYAVMGNGSAAIYSTTITGNVGWLNGAVQFAEQWPGAGRPRVIGNLYNSGSIALSGTDVTGHVIYTGAGSSSNSTHASFGMGTVPTVTKPSYPYTCPTSGPDNWGASGTLVPGTYGTVQTSGTVTLQAGTYYMQALNNWSGHTINLPATGNVNIFLCTDMQMNGGARILSPSNNPLQLFVYSKDGVINFQDNAIAWGVFTTGKSSGTVTLGQNVQLYGMAHSYWGIFQSSRGSIIDASGATGAACLSRGIDPSTPPAPTCPVTTPLTSSVAETGTCVANGTTHQVPTSYCPNADLAVDINCIDNTIPVCNHGNVAVPANQAELIFYPRAGQQFATTTPDAAWRAGTCDITAAIPAGTCINQICPAALLDKDLTVEVRLKASASVTECSGLDNWSYYVEGRTCTSGGGSGTTVVTETYEAICPPDSDPSWGFLTWQSSTPGASRIDFDARLADTAAGLSTALYTALPSAVSTPIDTQICSGLGPSAGGCPVDLTQFLVGGSLNKKQPKHMELRATLQGSGTNSPTLRDWKITYSCLYKQ